jgi:hypothetical protein
MRIKCIRIRNHRTYQQSICRWPEVSFTVGKVGVDAPSWLAATAPPAHSRRTSRMSSRAQAFLPCHRWRYRDIMNEVYNPNSLLKKYYVRLLIRLDVDNFIFFTSNGCWPDSVKIGHQNRKCWSHIELRGSVHSTCKPTNTGVKFWCIFFLIVPQIGKSRPSGSLDDAGNGGVALGSLWSTQGAAGDPVHVPGKGGVRRCFGVPLVNSGGSWGSCTCSR